MSIKNRIIGKDFSIIGQSLLPTAAIHAFVRHGQEKKLINILRSLISVVQWMRVCHIGKRYTLLDLNLYMYNIMA